MRASWSGLFRIGDVTLPVKLFSATKMVDPRFIQLHDKDNSPVTRITVCMQDGEEVHEDELVKAAEHNGKYIKLTDSDLERHTDTERNIVIRQFSDPISVNPFYYDKPYYLVAEKGGELAYAILRRAFEKVGKIAVVTLQFYGRERLGVVSTHDGILLLQMLRFADEIISRSSIRTPALPQPAPEQVDVAARLMERYSSLFQIDDYRNEQRDLLNDLIDRKAKGLSLPRPRRVSTEVTPSDEVATRMKSLLDSSPETLKIE